MSSEQLTQIAQQIRAIPTTINDHTLINGEPRYAGRRGVLAPEHELAARAGMTISAWKKQQENDPAEVVIETTQSAVGGRLLAQAIELGAFRAADHAELRMAVDPLAEVKRFGRAFRAAADALRGEQVAQAESFDVVADAIERENQQWDDGAQPAAAAPNDRNLMTEGERSLWHALEHRAETAKVLASELDTSERVIHKWKRALCDKGYEVKNQRGRGYYRPDAPPDDLQPAD